MNPMTYPGPVQVVTVRRPARHLLHAVLALCTLGLWLPVWAVCAMRGRRIPMVVPLGAIPGQGSPFGPVQAGVVPPLPVRPVRPGMVPAPPALPPVIPAQRQTPLVERRDPREEC